MGGVVEEFIEAPEKTSPSSQFRTSPRGEVVPISTHDQILGGRSGQIYLGCSFPARDAYRMTITEMGAARRPRAGRARACVSRYGVDFLAFRHHHDEPWQVVALEINLRVVGTTHPFLALTFLTGGELDTATRALHLARRAHEVLPRDRQPARGSLPDASSPRT